MICLNFSARPYGDAAIAAMAIVARLFHFAMSAVIGFGQGFQPVCGFNYGARRYDRVLSAFWFCVKTAAVFLTMVAVFGFMFSYRIISIFRKEDLDVLNIGVRTLRFQCLTFPLSSWIIMTNMLLQTIGKGLQASVVSASRQGLFFIPAILILPRLFGLLGVQISQLVSDVFSFLLAIPMAFSTLRELEVLHNEEK